MSVEFGLWRLDGPAPRRLQLSGLDLEKRLQDALERDLSIVAPELMLLGRQVTVHHDERKEFIDLLAIDRAGNLVVLELKRERTRREVVAQLLDYASWVVSLDNSSIAEVYARHAPKMAGSEAQSFDDAFKQRFGIAPPDELNGEHQLWIVANGVDAATERVVNYLGEHWGVPINAVFVEFLQDGDREYLARAWLRDPASEPAVVADTRDWNGEFYVSFGHDEHRPWEEARQLGFVSAGGGAWYTRTLDMLRPGDRIWVNVPGTGYVGVGEVTGAATPLAEATVIQNGKTVPLTSVAPGMASSPELDTDRDTVEKVVPIHWLHTVPLERAVKETGFFGNQNTVAKPTAEKWVRTVDRLSTRFGVPIGGSSQAR